MRSLGTELNMLVRLGFPKDKRNLELYGSRCSAENAWEALVDGDFAHVLYGVAYRGKHRRNKSALVVMLSAKAIECFIDDESFNKRANELYAKGVEWIGAYHRF